MKITDSQVLHVAALARLKLDPDEVKRFRAELNAVLEYMDLLSEVDTGGIEPLHHPFPEGNVFRHEGAEPCRGAREALENAPHREGDLFVVPKVIE